MLKTRKHHRISHREIKEETGLTVSDLKFCGLIYWYNDATKDKYFVFNFRTEVFSGQLKKDSDEGEVFWVDMKDLPELKLSEGLRERLPMFFEGKVFEGFGIWNEHSSSKMKWF